MCLLEAEWQNRSSQLHTMKLVALSYSDQGYALGAWVLWACTLLVVQLPHLLAAVVEAVSSPSLLMSADFVAPTL